MQGSWIHSFIHPLLHSANIPLWSREYIGRQNRPSWIVRSGLFVCMLLFPVGASSPLAPWWAHAHPLFIITPRCGSFLILLLSSVPSALMPNQHRAGPGEYFWLSNPMNTSTLQPSNSFHCPQPPYWACFPHSIFCGAGVPDLVCKQMEGTLKQMIPW